MLSRFRANAQAIFAIFSPRQSGEKHYGTVIPGEIALDDFSKEISILAGMTENKIFLEIGSSSGEGSTQSFISSLKNRPDQGDCRFYSLEVSQERYDRLKETYGNLDFFHAYRMSSVPLSEYPSVFKVIKFYFRNKTKLNEHSIFKVLMWFRREKSYLKHSGIPTDESGITRILDEIVPSSLDVVLLDGSEFTGEAEVRRVLGSKFILLDDTQTFKCNRALQILRNDDRYRLVKENEFLRNGYAIFQKN